jgi:hypothetical protein
MTVGFAYEPTCPQTYFNIAMEHHHLQIIFPMGNHVAFPAFPQFFNWLVPHSYNIAGLCYKHHQYYSYKPL